MATKKNAAKTLDRLFEDFFRSAYGSFEALERLYAISGIMDQVFGKDDDDESAKAHLHKSWAWQTLEALYEYAINGVYPSDEYDDPASLVIDGSDVLKLASSENYRVSQEWDDIVAAGDGRFALDDGSGVELFKLALLANVDIRTVRNAASSGELVTYKSELDDQICAENDTARAWLYGRRGFKPTVSKSNDNMLGLSNITTPAEFSQFLANRRIHTGLDQGEEKIAVMHSEVNAEALAKVAAGIFQLPLSAVIPLADYYQVDRKEFLECVMRVFFSQELRMIQNATERSGA